MAKVSRLQGRILSGANRANVSFQELSNLLLRLGFDMRIKGSHHIFSHAEFEGIITLQSRVGKAKPYQVRQVRNFLIQNRMEKTDDNQV